MMVDRLQDVILAVDDDVRWWLRCFLEFFAGHDRARWVSLRPRSYFICATPRSGSGLLGHMLWQTGWAGRPQEYFKDWPPLEPTDLCDQTPRRPLEARVTKLKQDATTWNGVLGAKVMADQLDIAVEHLRTLSPAYRELAAHRVLSEVFPRLRYVMITRRDKIRQAVSWAKAEQSGRWFEVRPQALSPRTPPDGARQPAATTRPGLVYDFRLLSDSHQKALSQEQRWEAFFVEAQVQPYRVVYEDLVEHPESVVRDVIEYIQVPRHRRAKFHDKYERQPQSDAQDREWADRFRDDLRLSAPP